MNASGRNRCEQCGAEIPAALTEKLCPACLLSGALDASGGRTRTISMGPEGALPFEGPAEFPCEFGAYRLVGLLGRGGMGTVYEAEERATGRRLALKMLGRQLDSPEMRQRFLREGRLAARVNHPNSLYIFGSEEIEGQPVITMEVAGGGTLKDQLKRRGPLPVAGAVDAVLDVIDGLESAHAHGVLHRDIKPSNCFVGPDGTVKVGDFGLSVSTLAKTDTFVTAHGRILGTPAYASPEQLRGDELDARADIYSVGATLFTLLTDRAPFDGENAVQVVANAVNQEPKPLRELRGDVPAGLERVVGRCLAQEPQGRFDDYRALRDALLPFSSREPEPASMAVRAAAGWIDYLIALLPPYVALMFLVGAEELLVRPLVERLPDSRHGNHWRGRAKRFLRTMDLDFDDRYLELISAFGAGARHELLSPAFREQVALDEPRDHFRSYAELVESSDPLHRALFLDLKLYLPGDLLTLTDRISMAHSLEVRVPFLDHELLEYAATIPPELKLRGMEKKYLLKQAVSDLLPASILNRRKMGFSVPLTVWFRRELRPYVEEVLSAEAIQQVGIFDHGAVRRLLDDHFALRANLDNQIWGLITFMLWHQDYIDGANGVESGRQGTLDHAS